MTPFATPPDESEEYDEFLEDEEEYDCGFQVELWDVFDLPEDVLDLPEEEAREETEAWLKRWLCRAVWQEFHRLPRVRTESVCQEERSCPGYGAKEINFHGGACVELPDRGHTWEKLCGELMGMVPVAASRIRDSMQNEVWRLQDDGYRVALSSSHVDVELTATRYEYCHAELTLSARIGGGIRVVERAALDRLLGDRSIRAVNDDPFGQFWAF